MKLPTLSPLPAGERVAYCDCGRLASFRLAVLVGCKPRPVTIPLCACCAALEAEVTVGQLLACHPVAVAVLAAGAAQP